MQQRADRGAHITSVSSAMAFKKPTQRAVGQRLQRRRRKRDDVLIAIPQRLVAGQRRHAVPLGGVGACDSGLCQSRELRCRADPYRIIDRVGCCAHHRTQASDHRGRSQHSRRDDRFGRVGFGIGRQGCQLITERRRNHRLVAVVAVDRGDEQAAAGAAHGGDQQPALLGQQRRSARQSPVGLRDDAVHHIDKPLRAQHAAAGNRVGPQPFLQAGDDDELPFPAERRMGTEDCDRVGLLSLVAGCRGQPHRFDVVDEAAQRRARGARHILLGHVEQCGDRVEVPVGLRACKTAALTGGQPAPLHAGTMPGLPQCVARVWTIGGAAARGREHGANLPQRTSLIGRQRSGFVVERLDKQLAEVARRLAAIGAAQRPPQLTKRYRVDPADRPGQQRQRPVAVEPVRRRVEDRQQRPHRGLIGQRSMRCCSLHRNTRGEKGTRQRRAPPGHRPDDHRHLRPGHAINQMCAAQRVGDQRRFGVRRRGDPHG